MRRNAAFFRTKNAAGGAAARERGGISCGCFCGTLEEAAARELVGKPRGGIGTIFPAHAGEYRVALQERLPAGGVVRVQRPVSPDRLGRPVGGIADPVASLCGEESDKGGVAVDEGDLRMCGKEPR